VLNSRGQVQNFAHMVDTTGISGTQRAWAIGTHPRADERFQLYLKAVAQMQRDPSESKMLVSDPEGGGGGQYYYWDPTGWWWWNDWQSWEHWRASLLLEEEVQYECGCLVTWPNEDDPTNYTIYTEDVLDAITQTSSTTAANRASTFAS
jgi:hypothetical protein